jgi:hydroxyacylglutathione hydrolase
MEWQAAHIAGARHVPLNDLSRRAADVPDSPLAIVCASGYRSSIAASLLESLGRRAANVVGGMNAWGAAKQATVSETSARA